MGDTENEDDCPKWWKERGKDYHDLWDQGIALHLKTYKDTSVAYMKVGVKLAKAMIPAIESADPRWKKFDPDEFNTAEYPAHRDLTDHVRNKIR